MRFMLLLVLLVVLSGCQANKRQIMIQPQFNFALHQDNSLER